MPKLWAKGCSEAHQYACEQLSTAGFSILQAPDKTIDGVLLDVPSFRDTDPADIAWEELPENAIVIGGNLAKHVPEAAGADFGLGAQWEVPCKAAERGGRRSLRFRAKAR